MNHKIKQVSCQEAQGGDCAKGCRTSSYNIFQILTWTVLHVHGFMLQCTSLLTIQWYHVAKLVPISLMNHILQKEMDLISLSSKNLISCTQNLWKNGYFDILVFIWVQKIHCVLCNSHKPSCYRAGITTCGPVLRDKPGRRIKSVRPAFLS